MNLSQSTRIMIVGGCFDILHPGHVDFLTKAKQSCDYLILLLEPDEKIQMMKGINRPINNYKLRISNLEKKGLVDEIILLPILRTSEEYQKFINHLISNFEFRISNLWFGITKNDRNTKKNENIRNLGQKMNIEVIEVNELLPNHSTSKILSNTN